MKIFITGATGFIGRQLCRQLHQQGYNIVALLRNPNKASVLPEGTELLKGNLSSFKEVNFIIPKCDVVIHLAAVKAGKKLEDYIDNNYHSVVDLIECLNRQSWTPKKFIFSSSLAAGGPCIRNIPKTAAMPDEPIDPYGKSKLMADEYLKTLNIPTISFRPTIVIGAEDKSTLALYKMAQKGLGFRPTGRAQQLSMVYIDDLIDAIVLLAEMDMEGKKHETYYVSAPGLFTIEDWFNTIAKVMEKNVRVIKLPLFAFKIISAVMTQAEKIAPFTNQLNEKKLIQMTADCFACNSQKLMAELNWLPKYNLESGTKAAIEGYKKAGWF